MGADRGYAWLGQTKEKKKNPPPPYDMLWGMVLLYVHYAGGKKEAAQMCEMDYNSFRRLLKKSPRDWREEQRQAIVKGLGISKKDYAEAWAKYAQ